MRPNWDKATECRRKHDQGKHALFELIYSDSIGFLNFSVWHRAVKITANCCRASFVFAVRVKRSECLISEQEQWYPKWKISEQFNSGDHHHHLHIAFYFFIIRQKYQHNSGTHKVGRAFFHLHVFKSWWAEHAVRSGDEQRDSIQRLHFLNSVKIKVAFDRNIPKGLVITTHVIQHSFFHHTTLQIPIQIPNLSLKKFPKKEKASSVRVTGQTPKCQLTLPYLEPDDCQEKGSGWAEL